MPHNNSNQNMKPHHLYEIIDKEGEDIFKRTHRQRWYVRLYEATSIISKPCL